MPSAFNHTHILLFYISQNNQKHIQSTIHTKQSHSIDPTIKNITLYNKEGQGRKKHVSLFVD